jgi:hypothetical protein
MQKRNGIQEGSKINDGAASSTQSLNLDSAIRRATRELLGYVEYSSYVKKSGQRTIKDSIEGEQEFANLTFVSKLNLEDIPGKIGACQPDGGIIYFDDFPILTTEGKTQKDEGNAIERFSKNDDIIKHNCSTTTRVMFASGEGTNYGGPIDNFVKQKFGMERSCIGGLLYFVVDENSSRLVEDIKDIIRNVLRNILNNIDLLKEVNCKIMKLHKEEEEIRKELPRFDTTREFKFSLREAA